MEVTYLRLDPVQPETDIFNKYMSQQIVYSSINQYGADVIIPKTLPMKLNGSTLCRNQFWYDNVPDLIVTTVQPSWSNGQPRVSVKFDSENLLQILQFCDTIHLQDGYRLDIRKNKVLLHQGLLTSMYFLDGTQVEVEAEVLYNNIDTTPPTKIKQATMERVAISNSGKKVYIGTVEDNFYKEWFKIVQEV